MQLVTGPALLRILIGLVVLCLVTIGAFLYMCRCGGRTPPRQAAPAIAPERLRAHVTKLAGDIGPRNVFRPDKLAAAAEYIAAVWGEQGYPVTRHAFEVNRVACQNLEVSLAGHQRPAEIIVVGAHYDTVDESPGADDNGSGVAALLELGRALAESGRQGWQPARTIRLVAFPNEEPPWFETPHQGSRVYARACKARGDQIVGMVSLETMGYFTDQPGSERYPPVFRWFYPDQGNFIGFITNLSSRSLLRRAVAAFRGSTEFPVECASTFASVPGVGWSDHAAFWAEGYPALMITDTALYRYPYYHREWDTPEKLDYDKFAEVTRGVVAVVQALAE